MIGMTGWRRTALGFTLATIGCQGLAGLNDLTYVPDANDAHVSPPTSDAHVTPAAHDSGKPLKDAGRDHAVGPQDGWAVDAPADASPTDVKTTTDAGASDAGTSDAGTSDAGTSDAGTSDAGMADAHDACKPSMAEACSGKMCGSWPDSCGNSFNCGSCNSPDTCNASGQCVCNPESTLSACGSAVCGTATNNCNMPVSCGTCGADETCVSGTCCAAGDVEVGACYCTNASGVAVVSWFGLGPTNCPSEITNKSYEGCTSWNWVADEFYISSVDLPGMEPIYRCSSSSDPTLYFLSVVNPPCSELNGTVDGTYLGFVYASNTCATTPLYRYDYSTDQNRWSSTSTTPPFGYPGSPGQTGYAWGP
jgi:hypothetical protein